MEYNLAAIHPFICLSCVSGSRAYGLHTPESDEDIKGVYLAPLADILTGRAPEVVQDEKHDVQYSELGEFCRQLELNNSGALELWASMGERQEIGCAPWLREFFAGRQPLSKRCFYTYTGNARAQLKRISSTHLKALVNEPKTANLADFAAVLSDGGAVALREWLAAHGLCMEDVAPKPVGQGVWALYRQSTSTGLFGKDCTCVARPRIAEDAPFLAYMQLDEAAYGDHCRRVAQFREWQQKRNAERLATSVGLSPEEGLYDVKHMAHVLRLLHTAREIATEGRIHVWRTHDAALLRDIRAGRVPYSEALALVEQEMRELEPLFARSSLPELPELGEWEQDLADLRIKIHYQGYKTL